MNVEDQLFKRCKSPLCSNIIYYFQDGTNSNYCSTDCIEDVNLQRRIQSLRKSKEEKEKPKINNEIDWDTVTGIVFPHKRYNTDLII